jgi:hypothetical protein
VSKQKLLELRATNSARFSDKQLSKKAIRNAPTAPAHFFSRILEISESAVSTVYSQQLLGRHRMAK